MSQTVLVVGGAGYVGSHCCKAFAQAGWNVVVFDNLERGWREMVQWGDFIEGDIVDREAVDRALASVKPDAVAHFAAYSYVGESVTQPGMYYRNNTMGTLNLLDAMVAAGLDKLIFSSTCATYGIPDKVPMTEATPQRPINPYGWSKLFVEQILSDYDRAHGFKSVKLRYFNAAGADFDAEIGERHEPETHIIPLAIQGQLRDGFELTIFGDGFPTRDGTCIRDYIHVMDLADAHVRAGEYLMQGGASEVFNLGTGTGTTVMEIVEAVERVSGYPVKRTIGAPREGDPPSLVASADKAREILGWVPKHSDIDTIISSAWNWHQKEANRRR